MTRQEVAVARSHIAVWKLVAASDLPYTLVFEDDIYFRRGFARDWMAHGQSSWRVRGGHLRSMFCTCHTRRPLRERRSAGFRLAFQAPSWVLVVVWICTICEWSAEASRPSAGAWSRGSLDQSSVREPRGLRDAEIHYRPERRIASSANAYAILPVLSKVGVLTRGDATAGQGAVLAGACLRGRQTGLWANCACNGALDAGISMLQ